VLSPLKHLNSAVEFIQSYFVDLEFPLTRGTKQLLSQPQWNAFEQKLKSDVQLIAMETRSDDVLIVSTTKTHAGGVKDQIDKFLGENALLERDVEMLQPVAALIDRCKKNVLDAIRSKLFKCNGQLQIIQDDKKSGFHVTASEKLMDDVERELQQLANCVVSGDYEIDKLGIPAHLMSQQGQTFLDGLQFKHEVVIELSNCEPKGATAASFSGVRVPSSVIAKKQVKNANFYQG
jgi:hypothetical protein